MFVSFAVAIDASRGLLAGDVDDASGAKRQACVPVIGSQLLCRYILLYARTSEAGNQRIDSCINNSACASCFCQHTGV